MKRLTRSSNRCRTFLKQGLHSFKRQNVMRTSKQSHFLQFNRQLDSKASIQWSIQNIVARQSQQESHTQFKVESCFKMQLKVNRLIWSKPRIILEIVRMRIHKWNEWMNGWKPKRPWNQHQISYLKPMDWARLEIFRGERISRSRRNLGGANVRYFFSSQRCKKSNR